jgi:imidazole glycerol-phosphate synthase subunit HisH
MRVALIDYGSGNLRSAAKALEAVADSRTTVSIVTDALALEHADRIVLPGVGAFADCLRGLNAVPGLRAALEKNVRERGKPFLGICVGMQLLAASGEENGLHQGLGWIQGTVKRLSTTQKIPHMGWNTLTFTKPHPLLDGLSAETDVYFVHSYALTDSNDDVVLATTAYDTPVSP